MKTTKRFDRAITKLYPAFHEGTLDAGSCYHCAVGNMCDNNYEWGLMMLEHGSGQVYSRIPYYSIQAIKPTGYSPQEIAMIEKVFIDGVGRDCHGNIRKGNKKQQFRGLCKVIEYLCKLDNIPNVMDYTKLFEYNENKEPIHQL